MNNVDKEYYQKIESIECSGFELALVSTLKKYVDQRFELLEKRLKKIKSDNGLIECNEDNKKF